MSKEGYDPCEILWGQWNHELSMRRLLNVLRNTQSYCTDNECLDDGRIPNATNPDHFLFLGLILVATMFFYYFRPRPQGIQGDVKPNNSGNNSGGSPPNPPPSTQ